MLYLHADYLHAECMRNILAAISYDTLVTLLEKSRDEAQSFTAGVDEDANGMSPSHLPYLPPLSVSQGLTYMHVASFIMDGISVHFLHSSCW